MSNPMTCRKCEGTGYDLFDTGPMGALMYSKCLRCRGSGLNEIGIKYEKELRITKAVDDAWEKK